MSEDDINLVATLPADQAQDQATTPPRKVRRSRTSAPAADGEMPRKSTRRTSVREGTASEAPARPRRGTGRGPGRESGVAGLGERAHLTSQQTLLNFLPDPLAVALPSLRQALLNRPFEVGLAAVADGLASALAPAASQVWTADPTPWSAESMRIGGRQLVPAVRLRALARATTPPSAEGSRGSR